MLKKKIAVGGISTECSTYSPLYQNEKDFESLQNKELLSLIDFPFEDYDIELNICDFDVILETLKIEHKLATEDTTNHFQFNGIKKEIDYDYVYCFGVSPNDLWFIIQTRKWCEMNLTTNMAKNVEGGYKYTVRKNLMIPLTEENFKGEIEKIV